ncbi:MAG: endolytic transglycosylase MltG [Deltaproteobacteria bacterium]|nr:endolytic transglycosylase MltG [Deltaproteobacteria bacterium]
MKRWILFALAGMGLLAGSIALYGFVYALVPPRGQAASKIVTLDKGLTFKQIARTLEEKGVIHGVTRFILLGRIVHAEPKIKAGEYCFDLPTSHWKVLKKIIEGRVKTYKVTIPEGYTISQIGDLLDRKGIVSKKAFLKEASSPELLSRYHIEGPNAEGYLFPDTYTLSKNSDPQVVIRFFLDRFRQVFTPDMAMRASELGFSEGEIVTIASIIEKETSDPRERPLVSAVIHNRLKKRIRLQSDPTVIYGIPDFNGNLTKRDLERYTPYNTYLIKGLPPGPISNPGIESLKAALFPAQVDYLYFVSRNDGTHQFSSSLKEHNMAVNKYQRHRKRARTREAEEVRGKP